MAGHDEIEVQPQPFDAKKLDPPKKRKRSESPDKDGAGSSRRRQDDDLPSGDEQPQPFNAKSLQAPKRRAVSPGSDEPRRLKRPGAGARISRVNQDAIRQRQAEREKAAEAEAAATAKRGINDVVRQHYNSVPERGREWRKTDSKIRGLRSFNNWVKSCIIQKFSPDEDFDPRDRGRTAPLLVLDIGCGKGGDLSKWQQAPQPVELYVGLDPADVSIEQARGRYREMTGRRGAHRRAFDARFYVKDCYGESIDDVDIVRDVGFDPSPIGSSRGFDVVSMMFCMHYAFESEKKARMMLRNVAGALKKGGRFIGCIPASEVLSERVKDFNARQAEARREREQRLEAGAKSEAEAEDGEVDDDEAGAEPPAEWGNSIYRVRFPGKTPEDGVFRPAFGWKYNFFLDEAVEEVPEYVVPWGAFRALAEDFNLELQYQKRFMDMWESEKDDPDLGPLSERMGVRGRGRGPLLISDDEREAVGFYVAFCFYKV